MKAAKKTRGRPPKAPEKGKRQNYTFRLHDETRERLVEAAAAANRTLSEEIERRVERSFEWERAYGEIESMLAQARDVTEGSLDARHFQAGHVKVQTSAGKIWAERGALDALAAPSIERFVKQAVAEAFQEVGLAPAKAEEDKP